MLFLLKWILEFEPLFVLVFVVTGCKSPVIVADTELCIDEATVQGALDCQTGNAAVNCTCELTA